MVEDEDAFPYKSYGDYVSALSSTDNAYQRLGHFFSTSPDAAYGSHVQQETQVPRRGSVIIMDRVQGNLETQDFCIGEGGSEKEIERCKEALRNRQTQPKTRIIFVSYHRDPFTGEYTGVNTDVLDTIGKKFKIHPEVLMWHFGSDYGLDKRFFHFAAPPIPSALSSRGFCHLMSDHALFSCCLHPSDHASEPDNVIIFARNSEFPKWSLLTSRLAFLSSTLPLSQQSNEPFSRWSSDLFVRALTHRGRDATPNITTNPIEHIIPYAQMILINATFVMNMWAMKVMHPSGKTSLNLEVHYDKQVSLLNEIRLNLDALRTFTTSTSSQDWNNMISDYDRVLQSTEQQINVVLAQKMTYRAAMASLDESRMGIEHTKRSMEQSARVKRLTQLALVFIPLSFSTSLFGMNVEVLGTGSGKAWMVAIAVALAYTATSMVWLIIDWSNVKEWWRVRQERRRLSQKTFTGDDGMDLDETGE